jgi:hypothetical protein
MDLVAFEETSVVWIAVVRPCASVISKVWDSAFALSDLWGTSWSGSQSEGSDAILYQRSRCSGASWPYLRALSIPSLCAWYSDVFKYYASLLLLRQKINRSKWATRSAAGVMPPLPKLNCFTPMNKTGWIILWLYRTWNIQIASCWQTGKETRQECRDVQLRSLLQCDRSQKY